MNRLIYTRDRGESSDDGVIEPHGHMLVKPTLAVSVFQIALLALLLRFARELLRNRFLSFGLIIEKKLEGNIHLENKETSIIKQ
jgi:hypothetical protein